MGFYHHRARLLTLFMVLLTALAGAASATAQPRQPNFVATPLTPDSQFSANLAKSTKGGMVSVIVKLDAEPLASYSGGVPGYPATSPRANGKDKLDLNSPASQRYRAYVNGKQDAFVAKAKQAIPGASLE